MINTYQFLFYERKRFSISDVDGDEQGRIKGYQENDTGSPHTEIQGKGKAMKRKGIPHQTSV